MAISCGACGKLMKYTQAVLACSGIGCKAMAHYACVASTRQDWRCVGCCYPTEISVQYLLGEILKKGSGMELLQGLIGKINDLVTDINAIRDENEYLKREIELLTNQTNINFTTSTSCNNKRKTPNYSLNKQTSQIPIATIDLVSSEDETNQTVTNTPHPTSPPVETLFSTSVHSYQSSELPRKVSIFVTCSNTTLSETYLKHYLEQTTKIKSIECIRVSCYDTYSMFQIKVDQNDANLLTNCDAYPQGCKVEVFGR